MVGDRFIDWFYSGKPSDKCFYWCGRKELKPAHYYEERDFALRADHFWNIDTKEFWRSFTGILLIPRKLYHDIGGYNESNIYMDHMEHEFIFRLKRIAELIDLGPIIDYDFYNIYHSRHDKSRNKKNRLLSMRELKRLSLRPNGNEWGCINFSMGMKRMPLRDAIGSFFAKTGILLRHLFREKT
jgi:hypothetical protein